MGNFEALDYVINGFNEIYRNVTIFYDENGAYMLPDYLENNKNVDIFMTADENFQRPGYQGYDVATSVWISLRTLTCPPFAPRC